MAKGRNGRCEIHVNLLLSILIIRRNRNNDPRYRSSWQCCFHVFQLDLIASFTHLIPVIRHAFVVVQFLVGIGMAMMTIGLAGSVSNDVIKGESKLSTYPTTREYGKTLRSKVVSSRSFHNAHARDTEIAVRTARPTEAVRRRTLRWRSNPDCRARSIRYPA